MSSNNTESYEILARITGQVKWFNMKAGYGFITVCDDGEYKSKDIFVHYSSILVTDTQYRYLVQGEYVDFDIVKPENDKYDYHAVNISGVKGGNIMCETRRISMDGQPVRTRRSHPPSQEPVNGTRNVVKGEKRRPPVTQDNADGYKVVTKKRSQIKTAKQNSA